jgi:hypothetical protein
MLLVRLGRKYLRAKRAQGELLRGIPSEHIERTSYGKKDMVLRTIEILSRAFSVDENASKDQISE